MPSLQPVKSKGKTYYRIVESVRVKGRPRVKTLHYLGSIENIMKNLEQGSCVAVKSFQHGDVAALMAVAKKLQIAKIIDKHVGKERGKGKVSIGETLLLAAINRAIDPRSKRAFSDWASQTSIKRFFPNLDLDSMTSQYFWKQMDSITESAIAAIEEELVSKVIKVLNININTLLYDITNFFTFISSTNDKAEIAKRGHNKQKRYDLRQFNVSLLLSKDEKIPLLSSTYEGNQIDVKRFPESLTQIMKRLRSITKSVSEVTLVYDKGNNAKDNQKIVDAADVGYVTSLIPSHYRELLEIPLKKYQTINKGKLKGTQAYRLSKKIWGTERTIVIFRSEKLRMGQIQGLEQSLKKCLSQLQEWKNNLAKPRSGPRQEGGAKRRIKKILKDSYVKEILFVHFDEKAKGADRLTWVIDEEARNYLENEIFGKRILMTNREDWSIEEIIETSNSQSSIEETFRQMKDNDHFAVRPQYHWTDQKIRVHVFICIIALLMGRVIEHHARTLNMREGLSGLMNSLGKIRLAATLSQSSGKAQCQWILEACDENVLALFKEIVPKKAPFVYTFSKPISL